MRTKNRRLPLLPLLLTLCAALGFAPPTWPTTESCPLQQPCPPSGKSYPNCAQPTQANAPNCSSEVDTLETSGGKVCGLAVPQDGLAAHAYLGIPYGTAKRWQDAKPASWSSTWKATQFGPICPQNQELGKGCYRAQSEDCLSLNVWVPPREGEAPFETSLLPVMVFIHGGAFVAGGSAQTVYDGATMATDGGVVVVTLNYRLGALGFLANKDSLAGNFGFTDQQLALEWVRDNIELFGGDPGQVTIFGESAGAMSVGLHLVAPGSDGLFRAAIMESNPLGIPYKTREQAGAYYSHLEKVAGCDGGGDDGGLDCLKKLGPNCIVKYQAKTSISALVKTGLAGLLSWTPVVDGTLVPMQPKDGEAKVPVLLGTNLNEGTVFAGQAIAAFSRKKRCKQPQELSKVAFKGLILPFHLSREAKSHYKPVAAWCSKSKKEKNFNTYSQLLTDFLFTCPNQGFADRQKKDVYSYQFVHADSNVTLWPYSNCKTQVCHGDELPYVFDSFSEMGFQPSQSSQELSAKMMAYWTNFGRSGNDPNGNGLVDWPQHSSTGYRILSGADPAFPYAVGAPFVYDDGVPGIGAGTPSKSEVAAVDCSYFGSDNYRLLFDGGHAAFASFVASPDEE